MLLFDPKRPVGSCKALLLDLMKGCCFGVKGLHLKGGTSGPLPSEASRVGQVLALSIEECLVSTLLQATRPKSVPASSDRVSPDVSFNSPMVFPYKIALHLKCVPRTVGGAKAESVIAIETRDSCAAKLGQYAGISEGSLRDSRTWSNAACW